MEKEIYIEKSFLFVPGYVIKISTINAFSKVKKCEKIEGKKVYTSYAFSIFWSTFEAKLHYPEIKKAEDAVIEIMNLYFEYNDKEKQIT